MNNMILKHIVKLLTPCIQLFGIYVILYGHISPGGGFAGGTIIATSLVLNHMTFGKDSLKLNQDKALKLICTSLIFYVLLKGYSFFADQFHWPHAPAGTPGSLFSGGFIMPLNIIIGIVVCSTIYIIYDLLSQD